MASNPLEITLRPFRISDAEDLLNYAGDEEVIRFTRLKAMTSKEEAISYIQNFCIPHPYCRSICINGNRCIGYVSIKLAEGEDRFRAQIGYSIAREYWGQSITTRAAKMAISEGFGEFTDLVRLQSFVKVENKASQRVLEKIGFHKEGVMRKYGFSRGQIKDMVLFSLLSTDPIP